MIYLLIGYMWLFIHRPWEVWPWMAEYRPERTFMTLTIVCWVLSGPHLRRWNRLHSYFILLILVMIASTLQSASPKASWDTLENYLKLVVFYVVLVTTVREPRDLRILVAGFVGALSLFALHSLREYHCGRVIVEQGLGRLRGVNLTFGDQNYFAGILVMSLPFAWILWREWAGRAKLAVVGCLTLLSWCVILSGSRMGFVGLLAAGALAAWVSPKRRLTLVISPLILIVVWSVLPEGQKARYLTLVGIESHATQAKYDESYRSQGFWQGWALLQRRPLLGFGLQGTRIEAGQGVAPHNTYGELFGDLGGAGIIAFAMIYLAMGQNFLEARRIAASTDLSDDRFAWRSVAAASAAFLLLAFMGWGLHFLYYFPWLWFAGFQAVALDCLKEQADVADAALATA